MTIDAVKTVTGGATVPPDEHPPVTAAAAAPLELCPMTGQWCPERPACELKRGTGRVYCAEWVKQVRQSAVK